MRRSCDQGQSQGLFWYEPVRTAYNLRCWATRGNSDPVPLQTSFECRMHIPKITGCSRLAEDRVAAAGKLFSWHETNVEKDTSPPPLKPMSRVTHVPRGNYIISIVLGAYQRRAPTCKRMFHELGEDE